MLPVLLGVASMVANLSSIASDVAGRGADKSPDVAAQATSPEGDADGPKSLLGVQVGETDLGEQFKNSDGARGPFAAIKEQIDNRNGAHGGLTGIGERLKSGEHVPGVHVS